MEADEIKTLVEFERGTMIIDTFKKLMHPSKICSFRIEVTDRQEPIVKSTFLGSSFLSSMMIANSTSYVVNFIAMHKNVKKESDEEKEEDDEMSAIVS